MLKNVVFTICSKNYLGLAQTLEKSLIQHNSELDFFIFIADEYSNDDIINLPANVFLAKNVLPFSEEEWKELSFKYTLVEFCTAIKPFCFTYIFESLNRSKIIFLDPDVFVFNSLNSVFKNLETYCIILTPHILTIEDNYSGDFWENIFLSVGTFNLGFIALKRSKSSDKMLSWWRHKLKNECYVDEFNHTATDQKWIIFLPMFFNAETLHISHDLGLNVATWNFYEREILEKDNTLYVKNRILNDGNITPLIFVHFSNYNYLELKSGIVRHYSLRNDYIDLKIVFDKFIIALQKSDIEKYISLKYSYNFFNNGDSISLINRRFYRRLKDEGEAITDPFNVKEGSYYNRLKKRGLITKNIIPFNRLGIKTEKDKKNDLILVINFIMRVLKTLIGINKYYNFIISYRKYLRPENQIHLLDNKRTNKYSNFSHHQE